MTVPDFSGSKWRKASHSDHHGGACVEVAALAHRVAVRDSRMPDGPRLIFGGASWHAFVERVKAGEVELR